MAGSYRCTFESEFAAGLDNPCSFLSPQAQYFIQIMVAYSAFAIEHVCMWDFSRNVPRSSLSQKCQTGFRLKQVKVFHFGLYYGREIKKTCQNMCQVNICVKLTNCRWTEHWSWIKLWLSQKQIWLKVTNVIVFSHHYHDHFSHHYQPQGEMTLGVWKQSGIELGSVPVLPQEPHVTGLDDNILAQ